MARRSRWRRWARRSAWTAATLTALLVSALVVVLGSLNRPWLKRRLVALAHSRSGLDVDWSAAEVSIFSGLRVERLTVATPPALRATAPELVRIDGLEVSWTARSLVAGTPRFGRLRVAHLGLTLVRDAGGRTSLSTIEPHGDGAPPPPEVPLSKTPAESLAGPPPIARIDVEAATVTVLAEQKGVPRERLVVDGLALHATLAGAGRGFRLDATLGTKAAPLALTITRTRDGALAGEGTARLAAALAASASEATAQVDLELVKQTLAPATKMKEVVHLEAHAAFGDGRVRVKVASTRLGDGAATTDAEIELPDGGAPRIVHAEGAIESAAPVDDGAVVAGAGRGRARASALSRRRQQRHRRGRARARARARRGRAHRGRRREDLAHRAARRRRDDRARRGAAVVAGAAWRRRRQAARDHRRQAGGRRRHQRHGDAAPRQRDGDERQGQARAAARRARRRSGVRADGLRIDGRCRWRRRASSP